MTETNPSGSSIILNGDVIEQLQAFDDNTFDACLCDPPYLLEFMGKEFDKQHLTMEGDNDGQKMYQWHLGWCRELYRVLKPGAFAMVFGGTRTSHRLACALEDVGFEIRDTIEWMYGSGFPKSHNISKGIDKINGETNRAFKFTGWMRSTGLTPQEINKVTGTLMGHHYTTHPTQPAIPTRELFEKIKTVLAVTVPDWVEELIDRVEAERPVVGQSTKARSTSGKSALPTLGGETKYETWDLTIAGREESALWSGYGTALKPAHEPLILCMKPFDGTFAENALEHGVAGLNIDGGRIAGIDPANAKRLGRDYTSDSTNFSDKVQQIKGAVVCGSLSGRWPANLILSHTPYCQEIGTRQVRGGNSVNRNRDQNEIANQILGARRKDTKDAGYADENGLETIPAWDCHPLCPVRLLDEQSGRLKSGDLLPGHKRGQGIFTEEGGYVGGGTIEKKYGGDCGSASRFFYCAKVSTSERESGMIGNFPCRTCGNVDSETHLDEKGKPVRCSRNAHPTLKPIDLCRYLATLLLPPPCEDDLRQIIVPFSGAGSEMAGALSAGWDMVIGIEMDREYIKWAKARIPDLSSGGPLKPAKRSPKPDPTLDLDLDIFS